MRTTSRLALLSVLLLTGLAGVAAARSDKPAKIPVTFGSWTGPGAGSFKSAVRPGLAKECAFVGRKNARAAIEGVVSAQAKGAVVSVTVKAIKTDEIVESREFRSPKPRPSGGLGNKMARAIADMVRRAPAE